MTQDSEIDQTEERAAGPRFLTNTKFADFDLPETLLEGLKDAGFERCTPIQAQVLPVALSGKDIAGQAQTGTGKTAAFLVPMFSKLLGLENRSKTLPSALIVAPTRELALQIYEEAEVLGGHTDFTIAQAIGGMDYRKQMDILKQGADILIGTPGRIIDYYKQGIFKTHAIKSVVIDEADRLLDLGFAKDMRYILRKMPHYEKRQSMLFSATLSYRVLELTYDYMNLPEFISVTPEEVTVKGIDQILYHVGQDQKLPLLLGVFKNEDWTRALVFVNTKSGVEFVAHKLRGNGFPAGGITGDLPQRKRLQLMERFKNGELSILVATDVASRGIHVEDVSHVINYDLPQDPENYVHRIGRTARAGKTGKAISLACEHYVFHLEPMEEMIGLSLPVEWPEEEYFQEDKAGPMPARKRGPKPDQGQGRGKGRGGKRGGKPGGGPRRRKPRKEGGSPSPENAPVQADGEAPKKKPRRRRRRKKKPAASPPSENQS
ncbi:DEAD/DEAH box helicase domain protein [Desulfatibacillum aliphaticivorans]|uniref:DEAD/DEAH box helicase domain protein n=1 Tax=Desulfatibacillum aliphaticivorans TaxID=218208 RepID=B8FIL9_DESAL|nr:DEAD/DEAH box helicase [Desulfatibacillum aliphaticivorans]ACL04009.1 DEAD/DEAH box helicase domain protein [Desulfatibacillum aliphaticivorans]